MEMRYLVLCCIAQRFENDVSNALNGLSLGNLPGRWKNPRYLHVYDYDRRETLLPGLV